MTKAEKLELLALLEEKRRRKAVSSLISYAKQIVIPGVPINDKEDCEEFYSDTVLPAKHHKIILNTCQKIIQGEIIHNGTQVKSLMILAPPGSAKSTYASVVLPTWYMGKYENKNIIMTTHGSDLARKFGRKCRAICKSKEFHDIFSCEISQGNSAADDWSITNASTYMCGGILSGITGNRADGLIIDDPFKNREEANSENQRKKVFEEYKETLLTRLKPNGWKVIINTRWHEDDLSGQILPERYKGDSGVFVSKDGTPWYVLNFQAECQTDTDPLNRKYGEYLWLDWFNEEWWEQTKKTYAGYSWNSLYQGNPTPDEGGFFKREWFKRYKVGNEPENLSVYGAADYAVSEDKGDYTEEGIAGFDKNEDLWLLDWWQGRTSADVWIDEQIRLVKKYKPLVWAAEGGLIRRSVEPFLKKEMQKQNCYFRTEWITSNKDKAANARAFQGLASQGKVWIPLTPEGDALIDQLISFPHGKFDDKVDVCGLFGRILDQTYAPKELQQNTKQKKDEYGLEDEEQDNWKMN